MPEQLKTLQRKDCSFCGNVGLDNIQEQFNVQHPEFMHEVPDHV